MTECFPPREKKGFAHYVSLLQHARAQMTATEKNPWLFGGKDLEKRAYISTDGETGEEQLHVVIKTGANAPEKPTEIPLVPFEQMGGGVRVVANHRRFGGLEVEVMLKEDRDDKEPEARRIRTLKVLDDGTNFSASLKRELEEESPPAAILYDVSQGTSGELCTIVRTLLEYQMFSTPLWVFGTEEQGRLVRDKKQMDFFTTITPPAFTRALNRIGLQWVRNTDALKQLVNSALGTLMVLQLRDGYTALHCDETAMWAALIAQRTGASPRLVELVRLGAELHDLGKTAVRDEVLRKPGRLTPEEFEEVMLHPTVGEAIARTFTTGLGSAVRDQVLDIILWHHRRVDDQRGGGYPVLPEGVEPSFGARIVAAADAWSAMTTPRYSADEAERLTMMRGITLKDKLLEIERCKGAQFLPEAAAALLDLVRGGIHLHMAIDLPQTSI